MKLVPIISELFRRLIVDTIGFLTVSENNNRYAITAVCQASKYPDAIPVKDLTSKSVIHALIQIFSKTGFPREIQCDLETSFMCELKILFLNKFDIKVAHSSLCNPQSNSVEHMHSTLKRAIKVLSLESGSDWERVLPMALFALHTITHENPTEIIHGKNLRMTHTIACENWMEDEEISQNVVDYILELNSRFKLCQDFEVKNMTDCQQKRKLWHDENSVSRKFKVRGLVLVLATMKPHKMAFNWIGPGVVTSVISDTNYTVDIPEKKNKNTIYHIQGGQHFNFSKFPDFSLTFPENFL